MTTQITSRDKKLLYMLGIIVIVALFYILGIRPLNKRIDKTSAKLEDAQVTHDMIEAKLYHLDIVKNFEEKAKTMAGELSARYYDDMASSDVDKLITNKALGYGLKVINLGIRKGKEPVAYNPYVNSEEMAKQKEVADAIVAAAQEGTTEETQAEGSSEEVVDLDLLASINFDTGAYNVSDTTPADVYSTAVTLDVYGPHDKAQALLDELINDKAITVTAFEWSDVTTLPYQYVNGELVNLDNGSGARLVICFDMFMYDGTKFSEITE